MVTVNQVYNTISYGPTTATNNTWPGQYRYYSFVPYNTGCIPPYNLTVQQYGPNSVLLNWDVFGGVPSPVTYIVEYGPLGFTPGTGTKVATSNRSLVVNWLQQDVSYSFYVRAVCDTVDTSAYSSGADYIICSSLMNTCLDFTALNSQGVTCTYGTYQVYQNYTGNYHGPYYNIGAIDNGQDNYGAYRNPGSRHTVHTRVGERDSCSGFQLLKIPPGECKSVRLGCVYGQSICQAITYDLNVDTNVSDLLMLKYACVLYNPSNYPHADYEQPRFVLEILDSAGNYVDFTCGSADFNSENAATPNSGWNPGMIPEIWWKDWTPVGLHLANYHGQHIKVRLTSFACGRGADDHFGYAYFTLSCAKAKIESNSCVLGSSATLSAPIGFNYQWYSSSDTIHPISTNRQVQVVLDTHGYHYCDVSFIDSPNCKFRMYHHFTLEPDTTFETIRPVMCAGAAYIANDDTMTRTGTYVQAMKTVGGCDSILTINLTVFDTLRDTIHKTLCAGATFDTNGHLGCAPVSGHDYPPYYTTGVFTQYLRDTTFGCFQNLVIDLTVNDTLRDTLRRTIRAGERVDTNGHLGLTPVSGSNYPPYYNQGVYTQYLRDTATGCFHNLIIDIIVNDTIRDTIRDTICAGAVLDTNGHQGCVPVSGIDYPPYYLQGVYTQYLRDTVTGYFRNLVIDLTVNDTLRDTLRRNICEGDSVDTNGHLGCVSVSGVDYPPYYNQGVYTQYLRDTLTGCFHNLVIDITVSDTVRDTVYRTICAGASFDTNGVSYTHTGFYSQLVNDNVAPCYVHRLYIDLTVNDTLRDTIRTTLCAGAVLDTNGHLGCVPVSGVNYPPYYLPGVYRQYLRHPVTGCFQNLVIEIAVNDTLRDTIRTTLCAGAVLDTNGHRGCVPVSGVNYPPYYLPGVYRQYLRHPVTGCFQNLVIEIAVNDTLRDTIRRHLCAGEVLDTNGHRGCVPVSGVNYPPYYLPGVYRQYLRHPVTGCFQNLVIDITVADTIRDTVFRYICAGASFDTNGQSFSRTGFYTQLLRNPQTQCYNRLYIKVTVYDTVRDTIRPVICAGSSIDTNGQSFTQTGFYNELLRDSVTQCLSRLYIDLTVNDTFRNVIWHTICAGATFTQAGQTYYRQGTYIQRFLTIHGCDSITEINLNVNDTIRDTIRRTICAGASFDTNGQSYTRAGFYSQLLRNNASGCYNRLYIRLTVRDTIRDTVYRILCAGTTFDTNGQTFSRTGFYSQLLRDPVTHCYNRLYIDIIVNDTLRDTVEHVVCAGKTVAVNGHPYYRDGWYRQKMRTSGGCDSVLHIHIIVPDTLRDTIYYDICAGQTVNLNGQTYTTTGWYRQKLQTRDGCDSILNIHLSVSDTISDSLYLTICVGKSIELNGQTFTKKGWYRQDLQTVKGCDSILHVHIDLDTPRNLKAIYKMTPQTISMQKMQLKFSDYSTGNPYDRKWIFREIPVRFDDEEVLHERFTHYTPSYESDSLRVTLIIMTNFGCSDTTSGSYPILKGEVWVPNAITPDADQNKELKVVCYNIDKYEIMIYTRAGLRVFHSTNIDESWDGTHNGKPCPSGTYVYRMIYTTKSKPNDSNEKSGTVLLVR